MSIFFFFFKFVRKCFDKICPQFFFFCFCFSFSNYSQAADAFFNILLLLEMKCHRIIYVINCCVLQGFLAKRKALMTHVKTTTIFLRVFKIANQLLTRHSPFVTMCGVVEYIAKHSLFSFQGCLSKLSRIMAAKSLFFWKEVLSTK